MFASKSLRVGSRVLRTTPVFDSYWHFAAERQAVLMRRLHGEDPPWTSDEIISAHRFTNAYRASDRVSQYLINKVIYQGHQSAEEVFFRTILFKIFNKIETWELLVDELGELPSWTGFDKQRYAAILSKARESKSRIYSAAYIMPSPAYGFQAKHQNHLQLLEACLQEGVPAKLGRVKSLQATFEMLHSLPSLGSFLAYQFAIDLNYSEVIDFSEMDFVVAGPGARDGIRKCFEDTVGLSESDVIRMMADIADEQFEERDLLFAKLGGVRPLQLIDCQNLFCEVDKYARA